MRAGHEAERAEQADHMAREGDDDHGGHLLPFCLVEDCDADDEGGYEHKAVRVGDRIGARGRRGGIVVNDAVEGGADSDTEPEEEGVDDGVDDADGAGDDGAGLQF